MQNVSRGPFCGVDAKRHSKMLHCTWTLNCSSLIQAPRNVFLWATKEKAHDVSRRKKSKGIGDQKRNTSTTPHFSSDNALPIAEEMDETTKQSAKEKYMIFLTL